MFRVLHRGAKPPTAFNEWRRIRLLVLVVLPFATGVIGALVIGRLTSSDEAAMLVAGGMSTALLTWCALWVAMRGTSVSAVAERMILCSVVAGTLNAPAALVGSGLAQLPGPGPGPAAILVDLLALYAAAVPAFVVGLPWSAPLGLVFGVVLAAPATMVARMREKLTLATMTHVQLLLGVVLALSPIAVILAAHVPCIGFLEADSYQVVERSSELGRAELNATYGLALAALALCLLGLWRLLKQRRWLRRVRRGDAAGWEIVPASEALLGDDQLIPFSEADRDGTLGIVRVDDCVASDPYRGQPARTAWTRVAVPAEAKRG